MSERVQAIRGMNDVLPEQTACLRYIEQALIHCLSQSGYQEIRFPIVESTQLFKRTIGEVTDIVEKEMYTFQDLNGESISLRPEGTAGCVRACLENGLLHNQQQKLWYLGPMFRHERPQKGRYRQFTQFGVEAFGLSGALIELELIALCRQMWEKLGIAPYLQLQINTLGELEERQAYKALLIDYFSQHLDQLDEDSKNRLHRNPLRILDSKNPKMQVVIANAPQLIDALSDESKAHFHTLCAGLDRLGIAYVHNPTLVRGLDYYGHTVFEWVTEHLGSQATVCAGGRYDALIEYLGGTPTPAVGFALGLERLDILINTLNLYPASFSSQKSVYMMAANEEGLLQCLLLADQLRTAYPHLLVFVNNSGGSFKSQFKKADKSGAHLALILGEEELSTQKISIKDLREGAPQITIEQHALIQYLNDFS